MDEQEKIKRYILGEIGDQNRSAIEERIMTDEDYFQNLTMVEENLIQDYVDGNLAGADRANFEKRFLISAENRQKVKFARALRKYVDENKILPEPEKKSSFFASLKAFFSSPVPATLGVLIILGFAGFFIWKSFSGSTDSEILIALNKAYRAERPVESRITDLEYAPLKNTRSANDADKTDNIERDLAKSLALKAVSENPSAENFHNLGRIYLTEKNFDEAVGQFEKAVKLAPNNAKLHNDFGAALIEKARTQEEKFENLDKALKEFQKSIELDNSLIEAYFNKAFCLQLIPSPESAKQAWREYLKLDSNSPWAEEARKNLQLLESQKTNDVSSDKLEKEFLDAFRKGADNQAWELLSKNKEIIQGKYLPQKLAMSLLSASGEERTELQQALIYAGNLEKDRTGDSFVIDFARFYANSSESNNALLNQAQTLTREGYALALKHNFKEAYKKFQFSRNILKQTGNIWEEKINEIYLAYCLNQLEQMNESLNIANEVVQFSKANKYKWLQTLSLYRLADCQMNLTQYNAAIKNFEESVVLSREMQDSYSTQKNLISLATLHSTLGQKKIAVRYMRQTFEEMEIADTSIRQKWRNYFSALDLFAALRYNELTKVTAQETIILGEQTNEPGYISLSQTQAGIFYAQTEDYSEAREFFEKAIQNAEKLSDEAAKKSLAAYSFLKLANLERKAGNSEKSIELYQKSLETKNSPYFLYETQKGRLLSYLHSGNEAELEKQIPATITILENNRKEILEEQQKNSYFNSEQNIYDIAVEWEFNRRNYEQAFNYAEASNARSLLEHLTNESDNPRQLSTIQNEIPPNVQILQYTVLDKKILIWLISREMFTVKESAVTLDNLTEKIETYLKIVSEKESSSQIDLDQLSRELYDILISPIREHLDNNKEICIIPQKILFHLPFQALVSPKMQPFLSEFAIFYSPSANVFILATKNAEKKSALTEENILSIGNPSFDQTAFDNLQDLPDAEKEANEIAQFYNKPLILINKQATKKALQNQMKNSAVIHFAGHYTVKPDLPLYSSLILAKDGQDINDAVLTNAELIKERLPNIKLVVLSACQTGVESYLGGEGLVGLSRSFLIANAPLVVASQWKVDSDATAELMKNFHRYRRQENLSTTAALRRAQLELINSPDGEFNKPYYWAAFAAFGGYAAF
ncbi:MAG: CHAT domain-containing protein [Pyrinomonadaceae bacterium]